MSISRALSEDHRRILAKIQFLERAGLDLQRRRTLNSPRADKTALEGIEDFLQSELGIMQHFKVEEEALFPVLRVLSKSGETAISDLVGDHKIIKQRFSELHQAKTSTPVDVSHCSTLSFLLARNLIAHCSKEDLLFPPLMQPLSEEQLMRIDEAAKRLGYAF